MTLEEFEALFTLFSPDLPRQGPGDDTITRRAAACFGALRFGPRLLDLGCGRGRQTLVLADFLGVEARIEALDIHPPYLERLDADAASLGLSARIATRIGDMTALPEDLEPGRFDLLWAEGSIFIIGFAAGLRAWRPLLGPGGGAVVSELCWLEDDPPAESREFWEGGGVDIVTVAERYVELEAAGWRCITTFPLPANTWGPEFHEPLATRVDALEASGEACEGADLAAVLAETRQEIDICQRFGDGFGYVYFVLEPEALIRAGARDHRPG